MLATNNSDNVVLKLAMDAPKNINENESLPDPIDLFTETSAGSKKLSVLRLTSQNEEEKIMIYYLQWEQKEITQTIICTL